MSLGENLQRLRKEKGLSQEEVARRLYVSRQSVSKWELDQSEPGVAYLKSLAKLYGVTLDELAGVSPPPPISSPAEAPPEETAPDSEDETYQAAFYWVVLGVRTAVLFLENLLYTLPYLGTLDFPLDWVFMLVGLAVRKGAIWGCIVVLFLVNIGFSLIRLLTMAVPAWGILGLLLNGLGLYVFYRPEIKGYFHMD